MNKNILVIENRKFLILDSIENDVNTEDTVLDTMEYSVESTDSESVELYYITAKPDFECVGYALEIL
jgi:hypothetical protein